MKMKYRIHFSVGDKMDHVDVDGETEDEIRAKADAEIAKRGGIHPWSQELPPE